MQTGNEIITLQFGSFANYIAAHYFNIQEAGFSFNQDFVPDVLPHRLFRASEDISTRALLSFTPRTIIVDDEIGNRSSTPALKSDVENVCGLSEGALVLESPNLSSEQKKKNLCLQDLPKNLSINGYVTDNPATSTSFEYKSHYNLENITCWSDFMESTLHQRSINLVPKEYGLSSPSSLHYQGIHCCFKAIAFWEQLEDNIRFFAEECDNLEGFQLISEGHSGFSGIATSALHYLKDEYGKKISIFTPAYFYPEKTTSNEIQRFSCNTVSCLADAKESVDLIVPVSLYSDPWCPRNNLTNRPLNNVVYKDFDSYENSAVLASGLELITLPYRMRGESNISMSDYCRINSNGRYISVAGIVIPFPMTKHRSLYKVLDEWNGPFFESISPLCSLDNKNLTDTFYTFSKGIIDKSSSDDTRGLTAKDSKVLAEDVKEAVENLKSFIDFFYFTRRLRLFSSKPKFRVPPSFPNIFNNSYNLTNPDRFEYGRISEFYGIGCLTNSKEVECFLNTLHKRAAINYRKINLKTEECLDSDFNSALENIATLASNYNETDAV